MTSPTAAPAAFHFRPGCLAVPLPPVRHLIYRCSCCGREFAIWRNRCLCHPSALLHAQEVDEAHFLRLLGHPGAA